MKGRTISCLLVLTIFIIFSSTFTTHANAQNSVKGTLTVSEETFQLKYAYVYEQGDEVAVFMTDNPAQNKRKMQCITLFIIKSCWGGER